MLHPKSLWNRKDVRLKININLKCFQPAVRDFGTRGRLVLNPLLKAPRNPHIVHSAIVGIAAINLDKLTFTINPERLNMIVQGAVDNRLEGKLRFIAPRESKGRADDLTDVDRISFVEYPLRKKT